LHIADAEVFAPAYGVPAIRDSGGAAVFHLVILMWAIAKGSGMPTATAL